MSYYKTSYEDCSPLLRDFLLYLQTIKSASIRTVDGYYIDLRTFFRFMKQLKKKIPDEIKFEEIPIDDIDLEFIKEITLSDAYEFLHFISIERKNMPATRSRKVSSIKALFRYLTNKKNLLENNPMAELEVPNLKKSLPKYLTIEQCRDLLNHVEGDFQKRDYCIITLFLNCGMRLSELVGINLNDIRPTDNNNKIIRLLGKGNKERIVYLNNACIQALDEYLVYREAHKVLPSHKNALFLTNRGTRIGARRVEQIIEENLKRAGLEQFGFSTHKLRHTAATVMYQYGNVDIRVLQEILGHANLGTTEIYTHLSSKQLEQAAKSTPLADIEPNTHSEK